MCCIYKLGPGSSLLPRGPSRTANPGGQTPGADMRLGAHRATGLPALECGPEFWKSLKMFELEQVLYHALLNDPAQNRAAKVEELLFKSGNQYLHVFKNLMNGELFDAREALLIEKDDSAPLPEDVADGCNIS